MNLQPSDAEPGLWVNADWSEGDPGLFAVVIGVSSYDHLAKDDLSPPESAPAAETTYGLGQLRVSAYTAYSVFRWLRDGYQIDGRPLAKCWLLLAPRQPELAFAPELAEHLTRPTFQACQQAIRFWRQSLRALPKASATESTAFFFFSGHGLEVLSNQQILLPCDYLAPPEPNWNDAISTANLQAGLASTPVGRQFFFLDACRNDHRELRTKRVRGAEILSEDGASAPEVVAAPLLYATGPGHQSFQPTDPRDGASIYGQALLAGLAGEPDCALEPLGTHLSVRMYALEAFVKERVVKLIEIAGEDVTMPVTFAGHKLNNEHVTVLDAPPGASVTTLPPAEPTALAFVSAGVPVANVRTRRVESALERAAPETKTVPHGLRHAEWGHDLFGSEHVTAAWARGARVFDLESGTDLGPEPLLLHRVDRDTHTRRFRVDLSLEVQSRVGHWLEVTDTSGRRHGCILPGDAYARPRYTIELDVLREDETPGHGRRFARFDGYLSRENAETRLGIVAELWMRLRTGDVGSVVESFDGSNVGFEMHDIGTWLDDIRSSNPDLAPDDLDHLQEDVRGKLQSPLAATVAALLLFRAGRIERVKRWVRNLANWFPHRPDGAVLWAEQVMRQEPRAERAVPEAASFATRLLEFGLPHTGEAMAYAAGLTDRLLAQRAHLPPEPVEDLRRLRERIDDALVYFRPGGLFTSFTAYEVEDGFAPARLLGPEAATDARAI